MARRERDGLPFARLIRRHSHTACRTSGWRSNARLWPSRHELVSAASTHGRRCEGKISYAASDSCSESRIVASRMQVSTRGDCEAVEKRSSPNPRIATASTMP